MRGRPSTDSLRRFERFPPLPQISARPPKGEASPLNNSSQSYALARLIHVLAYSCLLRTPAQCCAVRTYFDFET
eukprot:364315-Chlamydomonas_euryale.AAC.6